MIRGEKKIEQKRKGVKYKLGPDRNSSGFAYIIIPSDVERTAYIQHVYKTGFAMIIDRNQEIIKDAAIPVHVLRELTFPKEAGIYGALVSFVSEPSTNQVTITGILIKPGESFVSKEGVHSFSFEGEDGSISSIMNTATISHLDVVVNNETNKGGRVLKAQSSGEGNTAVVKILCNGNIEANADKEIILKAEKGLLIQIAHKNNEKNTLQIDSEGNLVYLDRFKNEIRLKSEEMLLESKYILHGKDAQQFMALGNTLQTELNKAKARIDGIIQALSSSPTVAQDGGEAYKAAINIILGTLSSENYSEILSKKNKVE